MIIPFFIVHAGCPHQCVFCNQKNITGSNRPEDPASIPGKIVRCLATDNAHESVQVAFYGGSFTALPLEMQRTYLEAVRPFIHSGKVRNIRLSTRPDGINNTILSLLKEYDVTVVELGVQSMVEEVLTRSRRGHTADDTVNAVKLLKKHGFSVGLQLMPGLPGDSFQHFAVSISRIIELDPDFVRIYPALVIKDTPLENLYKTGRYTPLTLDEAVCLCQNAYRAFEKAGIAVIRMGLQPTSELGKPGTILAGPFHPAFGQLVESSRFLEMMRSAIRNRKEADDTATFLVHARDISSVIGQHRSNLQTLKREFGLRNIRFVEKGISGERGEIVLLAG